MPISILLLKKQIKKQRQGERKEKKKGVECEERVRDYLLMTYQQETCV